jgi:threonyl-tRNA synthetase
MQAMIIAVHKSVSDYAREVYERVYASGFEVEFDEDSPDTLNKRIRNAQLEQFNFILVVGQAERDHCTVNVRTRDNQVCNKLEPAGETFYLRVHTFLGLWRNKSR